MDLNEFMQAKDEGAKRESRIKPMLETLEAQPNKPFSIKEIAEGTGLKESTILSAIRPLKKQGKILTKRINGVKWLVFITPTKPQEENPNAPIREHPESNPQGERPKPLEDNPGSP